MSRFITKEQGGVIAVIDTLHPDFTNTENVVGLNDNNPFVVACWQGLKVLTEEGAYWEVTSSIRNRANDLCVLLNKRTKQDI